MVEGSDQRGLALDIIAETNSKIDSKCTTASADKKDVSLSYMMSIKSYLDQAVAEAVSVPNKDPDFSSDEYRAKLFNSLVSATGTSAAQLKFSVAASAGGLKWADFDLSVILKLDNTELSSTSYTESSDHAVGAQAVSLTADLTGITEASSLTLTGTGTLQLACTSSTNSIETAASLRLGYPRLLYTETEIADK